MHTSKNNEGLVKAWDVSCDSTAEWFYSEEANAFNDQCLSQNAYNGQMEESMLILCLNPTPLICVWESVKIMSPFFFLSQVLKNIKLA